MTPFEIVLIVVSALFLLAVMVAWAVEIMEN